MYKLTKGYRTKDKPSGSDTAFLQFALKYLKSHDGRKYTGPIDGKWSDEILDRLFEVKNRSGIHLSGDDAFIITHLRGVNSSLPSGFQQYQFNYLASGPLFFLSLKSEGKDTNPYEHAVLTMPNKEAKQLVRFISSLARVYKIQATIRSATVSPAGKIYVSFTLEGGLAIDSRSGKIVALSKVFSIKKFARIVATRVGRGQMDLWETISKTDYALGTVSKTPYAEKKGSKVGLAWILGWKNSRTARKNPVVESCLEIYSQVRVLEKPDATKVARLQQCFGEYWTAIQAQEDAHKFLCSGYVADLKVLISQRNNLLRQYVLAQDRLASLGFSFHSEGDIIWAMALEATGFVGGKAANVGVKKLVSDTFVKVEKNIARKGTLKLDTFKAAASKGKGDAKKLAAFSDEFVATSGDATLSDIDAVDVILIAASVAAIVTAGTILGPIVLTAGIFKTAFDVYDARDKLLDENQELQKAIDTVDRIRGALKKQIEEIQALILTMHLNNCFVSVKDYDFTAQDLSNADSELAKLGVVP